jgi:DHA1 family multidrug resistance protein-like MFS transporter
MIARKRSVNAARRKRRRHVDPVLTVVCLAIAATQSAWAVIVPILPLYVEQFDASALDLGIVVALFGVGRLLANIPAGFLCQYFDPRKILVFSVLGVVVCLTLTGFVSTFRALLVLRLLTGIAGGVAITSGITLVAMMTVPSSRGFTMSMLHSVQLVGSSSGMALGGVVYAAWGERAPFLVCGVFAAAVLAGGSPFLFRSPHPSAAAHPATPRPPSTGTRPAARALLRDRSFLALCAVGFSVFFHRFGGLQSVLPLFAYSVVGLGVAEYAWLQGSVGIAGLGLAVLAGILSDRLGRKAIITSGLAIAGFGLPILALTDDVLWFVAVVLVTSLAVGFSGPPQQAYLADIAPPTALGPAIGVFRSVGDLAGIIGPIVLGLVADYAGLQAAVLVLSAVMIIPVLLFALTAKEAPGRRRSALQAAEKGTVH